MTDRPIIIKRYTGSTWDNVYPKTTIAQVINLSTELANLQTGINNRLLKTGKAADSEKLDGLNSTSFGTDFGSRANTATTTAAFITLLTSWGMFNYGHAFCKFSWDYAGNADITDITSGSVEISGAVCETWQNGDGTKMVRLICPNTGGGNAYREFIYNDQGAGYSPGWREVWNSKTLTNLNQLTNGPGYIKTVTSSMIETALGSIPAKQSDLLNYVPTGRKINGKTLGADITLNASDVGARASSWVPSWTQVSSKPSTFPPIIGSGAADAVAGNDPRLTDARTPTTHSHAWSTITSKPTNIAGYGITDATKTTLDGSAITQVAYAVSSSTLTITLTP